jgi:hypothetical protein
LALLTIFAVLAGSAVADSNPPATGNTPTQTQPAVTTDDSGDVVVLPVVTAPQTAPAINLAPGVQERALLMQPVRQKIVLYRKLAWHWQSLLGRRQSSGGNIWALSSLTAANESLTVWRSRSHRLHQVARRWMRTSIQKDRSTVEHWRLVMGEPVVRTLASSGKSLEEQFAWWRQAKRSVMEKADHPLYESQLSCIHYNPRVGHGEGAWDANTGNGYFGGLQMNLGFMRTYGRYLLRTKGTADHWTPLEQMWVAAKAVESGRGFYPWPRTAAGCGLI